MWERVGAAEALGVCVGETVLDCVCVGVREPLGVSLGVGVAVRDGAGVCVAEWVRVHRAVAVRVVDPVRDGAAVHVHVTVPVGVAEALAVPVTVALRVNVSVRDAVGEGLRVGVGVPEGVWVRLAVAVPVPVAVGEALPEGVCVALPLAVGLAVAEGVTVGVTVVRAMKVLWNQPKETPVMALPLGDTKRVGVSGLTKSPSPNCPLAFQPMTKHSRPARNAEAAGPAATTSTAAPFGGATSRGALWSGSPGSPNCPTLLEPMT